VNQRASNGIFGNAVATGTVNAQFDNRNSFSRGIGSGGVFDNRTSRNSGNVTIGANVSANSAFGPSFQAGTTRSAGFVNAIARLSFLTKNNHRFESFHHGPNRKKDNDPLHRFTDARCKLPRRIRQ
jgi:hypothetical protein